MITQEHLIKKLKQEYPYLKKQFHVKKIGIFGTFARSDQQNDSDLDILVELERPISFFRFIDLENYLAETLGVSLDLVSKHALKDVIRDRILEETIYV